VKSTDATGCLNAAEFASEARAPAYKILANPEMPVQKRATPSKNAAKNPSE